MDLRETQRQVMANKRAQGFNVSDIPLEICLLQGEITEFFQAWRQKRDDLGEELADVAIYLLGLAEMANIDLEAEIKRKIHKNRQRRYIKKTGC